MKYVYLCLIAGFAMVACATPEPTEEEPQAYTEDEPDWDGLRLPEPTGDYHVGHRQYSFVDDAREEPHTPDEGDFRDLRMEIWYPAEPEVGSVPGPYAAEEIAAEYGLDEDASTWLGYAIEDAPLAEIDGDLPVVIFNAGITALPSGYTALLQEFASQGYVVAAINHPYADDYALLSTGEVVKNPGDNEFILSTDPADPFGFETYIVWIPDTLFVLFQLEQFNDDVFNGQLDLENVGFMGHSFGGGVSMETCRILADICAGAINLDGRNPGRLQQEGLPAPFFYLAAEATQSINAVEVRRAYETAHTDAYIAIIEGATHSGFTDGYWLREASTVYEQDRERYGSIEPDRMLELVRAYSIAFFDKYLRGDESVSLEEMFEADEETRYGSK